MPLPQDDLLVRRVHEYRQLVHPLTSVNQATQPRPRMRVVCWPVRRLCPRSLDHSAVITPHLVTKRENVELTSCHPAPLAYLLRLNLQLPLPSPPAFDREARKREADGEVERPTNGRRFPFCRISRFRSLFRAFAPPCREELSHFPPGPLAIRCRRAIERGGGGPKDCSCHV